MGLDAVASVKYVAYVPCSGSCGTARDFFEYEGPADCVAAMRFGNKGPKACQFSCIGLGNCVRACQFGAMHIENGVAVVDREKCTSCMACASACPKGIIQKVPYEQRVLVGCRSNDKGAQTRKLCDAGCIGCMNASASARTRPSRSSTAWPPSTTTSAPAAATAPRSARGTSSTRRRSTSRKTENTARGALRQRGAPFFARRGKNLPPALDFCPRYGMITL